MCHVSEANCNADSLSSNESEDWQRDCERGVLERRIQKGRLTGPNGPNKHESKISGAGGNARAGASRYKYYFKPKDYFRGLGCRNALRDRERSRQEVGNRAT